LGRFVLRCLLWLPPAFALWYFAAPLLLAPSVWLAQGLCALGFSDLVRGVTISGSTVTFVTRIGAGPAAAGGVVTVDVNLLLYSFGLPLYAALTLASRNPRWKRLLAIGYAVLLPFVTWGLVADMLKNIAITSDPAIASQAGFSGWQREAIALAYQLGSLILPAVVPVVLWVATQLRPGAGSPIAAAGGRSG
jgi:hypothetical protein